MSFFPTTRFKIGIFRIVITTNFFLFDFFLGRFFRWFSFRLRSRFSLLFFLPIGFIRFGRFRKTCRIVFRILGGRFFTTFLNFLFFATGTGTISNKIVVYYIPSSSRFTRFVITARLRAVTRSTFFLFLFLGFLGFFCYFCFVFSELFRLQILLLLRGLLPLPRLLTFLTHLV